VSDAQKQQGAIVCAVIGSANRELWRQTFIEDCIFIQ